ncbi:hypothetical protein [Pseudomonas indica]|nr:hypothetical protein [Pseudomonas indica]
MLSSADAFLGFIKWILSLHLFSEERLAEILEEFNGIQGVVENDLYISAYEEVARYMSRIMSSKEMVGFLKSNNDALSKLPREQYYFVEAVIDEYSAKKMDVSELVSSSPERYREYLNKRFG